MIRKISLLCALFTIFFLVSRPLLSHAESLPPLTGPETAKKFNEFRQKAGANFVLPQVFKNHPGVTFMLAHATDLSLTDKQIKKLKVIRRTMINRSLSQFKKIESMRASYLKMAMMPTPSPRKIHKDLHAIAWLMAQSTADHLSGHIEAFKVLTKAQQSKLATLK